MHKKLCRKNLKIIQKRNNTDKQEILTNGFGESKKLDGTTLELLLGGDMSVFFLCLV